MFLHIGENNSVPLSDVVCILDCQTIERFKNNEGNKSVIMLNNKNDTVHYSKISTTALCNRLKKEGSRGMPLVGFGAKPQELKDLKGEKNVAGL